MGSWYGTCGITQMPLISDEIVMIPLKQRAYKVGGADVCYSNEVWAPFGAPIFGKYDDYGQIAEHDGQGSVHLFNVNLIYDKVISIPSERGEEPVNHETILSVEGFLSAIHEDSLKFASTWYGGSEPEQIEYQYSKMYILRSVWDNLVAKYPKKNYRGQIANKELYVAEITEMVNNPSSGIGDYLDREYVATAVRIALYRDATMVDGKVDPIINVLIDQLAELCIINNAMHEMRKLYMPQCGAGSQANDYRPYEIVMEAMQKTIKEWNDDCGDEEYDE